jgi:hypothetical protein
LPNWSFIRTLTGLVAKVWAGPIRAPALNDTDGATFARIGWLAWAATSVRVREETNRSDW